jgi:dTDP-glucose 4,6-dehydratase
VTNVEMVELIASMLGVTDPKIEAVSFHSSRPGHDLRYALDGSKLAATGWTAPVPFEESLRKTVAWYVGAREWLA